jgi:hypothetical protein
MFFFFDDPEGPNLLVVTVMAAIVYCLSLAGYVFTPSARGMPRRRPLASLTSYKKLLLVICIQILLATAIYFCL